MPRSAMVPMVSGVHQVDLCGKGSPRPLLELIRAMRAVPTGCILEVLVSDPGSSREILAWIHHAGYDYLGTYAMDGYVSILVRQTWKSEPVPQ